MDADVDFLTKPNNYDQFNNLNNLLDIDFLG